MADTVRYLLEEMVPELEALEARGYFSRAEIRSIVQRRQEFEYSLKRMAALKGDYLRYIAYEGQLEELREARRASRAISGKKSLAEFCIVRRIHFIYERATRKFRGDLDLWSRWLRFCQQTGSNRQMSKVLTKALQLHSGCAALWTYAAAWEFEHNLNAGAARALMQRGLRMCKDSPGLWHEYFRMELLYALRLRERRRVLGIAGGDDDIAGGPLSGCGGEGSGGGEGEGGAAGDESAAAVAAVLNGAVALVVYRSAVAAVPASVPFRRRFLEMLHPLDFPGKAALEDAVYDSVARDFGGSPEAWDLRARRHLQMGPLPQPGAPAADAVNAAVQAAVEVYEQGLQAAPSSEMAGLMLAFLQQQAAALEEQEQELGSGSGSSCVLQQQLHVAAEWLRLRTQRAFEEAEAAGLLTEAVRLDGIAFFLHHGDAHAAMAAARFAVKALPQSAALWLQLIVLEAALAAEHLAASGSGSGSGSGGSPTPQEQGGSSSDDDDEELPQQSSAALVGTAAAAATQRSSTPAQQRLEGVVLQALRTVPAADAAPVWLTGLSVLSGCGCSLQALSELLLDAAMRQCRGPVEGGLGSVAAALLTALHQAGAVQAARGLYRALLPLPPLGGDFFRCLLQLEIEQQQQQAAATTAAGESGSGSGARAAAALSARQLQDLFEAAVDAYGSADVQLWLLYAEWQAGRGQLGEASAVYWKACKALAQPEEFEAAYQLRFKLQLAK